jgi:site-specific recombinase XerC
MFIISNFHLFSVYTIQLPLLLTITTTHKIMLITSHSFRHSFVTHLLERSTDICTIQALLGHKDVFTTMIYTHILQQGGLGVASPLDDL